MRVWWLIWALLGMGCTTESDNARSTTGPTVIVHCDAATPVGDTTSKITCPTAEVPQ